ncbi:MAG: hypothetical protein EBU57_07260 [Alphaproteobacteria bacterium]|nr:hypothetical protein [Alphaproteobacteria bacterium]
MVMAQPPVTTHDVKIARTSYAGDIVVDSIPPEEFFFDRNARSIDDRQAGWLIPQDGFTPESLTIRLEGFVNLTNTLTNAAEAARSLGGRNAADAVADQVERLSGARPNGGAGPASDPVREIAA